MSEREELAKRIADLEAELAQLKSELPPPKKEFVSKKPWQPIDYTEQCRLPADAAQAMARVVPDVERSGFNEHAHAQTKVGSPGGFGPEKWVEKKRQPMPLKKVAEVVDTRSPQTRIFDAMVDALVGGPNDTSKLR